MSHKVGALLLAAGFSRRFGGSKLTTELANGRTVFAQTLVNLQAAIPDIVVVTRPDLVEGLIMDCASLQVFDGADQGMGATLAYGVGLMQDKNACLICLADMPFIQPQTYSQLAAHCTPDNIILPVHDGHVGNPCGFGQQFFTELMQLDGDTGGKSVIKQHPKAVQHINVADAAILQDIDTPEDLQKLQSD
ncbi:MAG: nucleotidyltransferase family protein [Gammaproteobacteria bacterium]